MIIEILIVSGIILLVAHVFVHYSIKNSKNKEVWTFEKEAMQISQGQNVNLDENDKTYDTNTDITLPVSRPKVNTEKDFLEYGKIIANEQKIKILNHRLDNLERALTQLAKKITTEDDLDIEKIDFKIKVLEQKIDELKKPVHKNTFFGKEHDPLEKEIKALAFNSKRK